VTHSVTDLRCFFNLFYWTSISHPSPILIQLTWESSTSRLMVSKILMEKMKKMISATKKKGCLKK